jgi:AcrR family transcriptional regulator
MTESTASVVETTHADLGAAAGEDTASRLVRAAIEVFAERGYDGAGVSEIARRAGLSTGAIYSRFSGKAELLAEAIAASGTDELDRLFAQADGTGRVVDVLAMVGNQLIGQGEALNRALLLEAFAAARRDPEVALWLQEALALRASHLAHLIDQGKAAGLVAADLDTTAIVHFAHAVGLGMVLFGAIGATQPDAAEWQQLIGRVVGTVVPTEST